jgi:protein PhnA
MSDPTPELLQRAGDACELCGRKDDLQGRQVSGSPEAGLDAIVAVCGACQAGLEGGEPDDKHWFCLKESAWSEVLAVQVVVWRQLHRLTGQAWAEDLLGQIWLPEEVQAWATPEEEEEAQEEVRIADINGTTLEAGDAVTITKDLVVQGGGFTAKRGTLVKNIKMSSDPTHIEGSVNGVAIFIKTCFVKKA